MYLLKRYRPSDSFCTFISKSVGLGLEQGYFRKRKLKLRLTIDEKTISLTETNTNVKTFEKLKRNETNNSY